MITKEVKQTVSRGHLFFRYRGGVVLLRISGDKTTFIDRVGYESLIEGDEIREKVFLVKDVYSNVSDNKCRDYPSPAVRHDADWFIFGIVSDGIYCKEVRELRLLREDSVY